MALGVGETGWNHNLHYHDRLLAAVPKPCGRALDVGCGLGGFARRLSVLADEVDAVDGDATVIRRARGLSADARNVRFIEADFMAWAADDAYDFISMIAAVHHLPFREALAKAADLLRPGGVLVILGLERRTSVWHAIARSLIAYPVSVGFRLIRGTALVGAPIREPAMTFGEIQQQASGTLPGAMFQRHLLWRYSMLWRKPPFQGSGPDDQWTRWSTLD